MIQPLGGEYQYGIRVQIGYFDQQMAHYTSDATVMDDYWAEYPNLTNKIAVMGNKYKCSLIAL